MSKGNTDTTNNRSKAITGNERQLRMTGKKQLQVTTVIPSQSRRAHCFPQLPKFLLTLMCFSFIRESLFLLAISHSCTSTKASCVSELVADKRLACLRTSRRLFLENHSSIRQETRASFNLVSWHSQGGATCCTGCVSNRVDEERNACC